MDAETFARVSNTLSPAEIQIEDDIFIAPGSVEEMDANILCLNHSCNPNVGVRGQITFVAMCNIQAGIELTIDYAMIDGDPGVRMECSCGAVECRKQITGNDWKIVSLQRRYTGYFSCYLDDRIAAKQR